LILIILLTTAEKFCLSEKQCERALSNEEKEIETALLEGEFKPLKGKELESIENALKAERCNYDH
jgi:hypothetical protein